MESGVTISVGAMRCRCCLAPGAAAKDLSSEYDWMGEKEIYADMLLESFDVRLQRMENAGWTICDTCITRLRDSTNFKKQVLYSEKTLLQSLGVAGDSKPDESLDAKPGHMKTETHSDDDDHFEVQYLEEDLDLDEHIKGVSVKLEPLASTSELSNDEDMPLSSLSSSAKRKATSRINISHIKHVGSVSKLKLKAQAQAQAKLKAQLQAQAKLRTQQLQAKLQALKNQVKIKPPSCASKFVMNKLGQLKLVPKSGTANRAVGQTAGVKKPLKIAVKPSTEASLLKKTKAAPPAKKGSKAMGVSILEMLEKSTKVTKKHRDQMSKANSALILENSTVCPFKWSVRTGYGCFFCDAQFHDGDVLREHTKTEHAGDKVRSLIRLLGMEEMIKVDVTTIACKKCSQSLSDMDSLKDHLKTSHSKKFYDNVNDGVLPYKLTMGSFNCLMCSETFRAFHMLNQHMNKHFENYVCETCGVGFVTQARLHVHQNVHKFGEFKCTLCDKMFESFSARTHHITNAHSSKDRFKCPQCTERFVYYHQRQRHLIKMHDAKHLQYTCKACGKVFMRKWHLTQHLRKESCI